MMWRSTSFDAKGVATAHCLIDGCSYVAEYMAALKNRQVASVKRTAGLSFNPRIKTDKSHEKLPQQCGFAYYMFRGVVHGCLVLLRVEDPVLEALALFLSQKGSVQAFGKLRGRSMHMSGPCTTNAVSVAAACQPRLSMKRVGCCGLVNVLFGLLVKRSN